MRVAAPAAVRLERPCARYWMSFFWPSNLYKYVIIAAAVMSWLIAFNVVNIRNDVVRVDLEHAWSR